MSRINLLLWNLSATALEFTISVFVSVVKQRKNDFFFIIRDRNIIEQASHNSNSFFILTLTHMSI